MNTNGQVMLNIFDDKNINKDERYMLLIFISRIKEFKEETCISISKMMELFQTKRKNKILDILKSLENKGYIEIIKSVGKTNKYKIIKDYIKRFQNNLESSIEVGSKSLEISNGEKESDLGINTSLNNESVCIDFSKGNLSLNNDSIDDYFPKRNSNLNFISDIDSKITSINNATSMKKSGNGSDTSIEISGIINDTSNKKGSSKNGTGSYFETSKIVLENQKEDEENSCFEGCFEENYGASLEDNNINNKYINNYKLYINIFNTWNKTKIKVEKVLSNSIKGAIEYAVKAFGESRVLKAIKNYSEVYYSDYYYDYSWSLVSFLKRENGVKRFLDKGDMWQSYTKAFEKIRKREAFKINIEDYID
ncbi:hypothetical protein [uncultured Clostridium sp.]|uniref:hypothetical protein n=2 Tax=Clostridia TaxID=186801 RepID=UPI0026054C45|nr:hypothetical protein [uncultured Clostridium sp.]